MFKLLSIALVTAVLSLSVNVTSMAGGDCELKGKLIRHFATKYQNGESKNQILADALKKTKSTEFVTQLIEFATSYRRGKSKEEKEYLITQMENEMVTSCYGTR